MVEINAKSYKGYKAVEISNSEIKLLATVSTGPRILSLNAFGSENMLAELPDTVLEYPGEGDLQMIGGHRLWYAPETPATTYIPDSDPVSWQPIENGIELTQEVDVPTGVQKKIKVQLAESGAKVKITHSLKYLGKDSFTLAPWAITQLRPGGKAVIPQKTDNADPNGLLPNRNIVLWPYTNLASKHIHLGNEGLYVHANVEEGALKIGSPNPNGWIGYSLDGLLFVKRSEYVEGGNFLDRGASSQIYCNPDFIELETLGPVVSLGPEEGVEHIEEWEVFKEGEGPIDDWQLLRKIVTNQSTG